MGERRRLLERGVCESGRAKASVCKFLYCCCIKLKFTMQFCLNKTSSNKARVGSEQLRQYPVEAGEGRL